MENFIFCAVENVSFASTFCFLFGNIWKGHSKRQGRSICEDKQYWISDEKIRTEWIANGLYLTHGSWKYWKCLKKRFKLKMSLGNKNISLHYLVLTTWKIPPTETFRLSTFFSKYFSQDHYNLISDNLMSLSRVINQFFSRTNQLTNYFPVQEK